MMEAAVFDLDDRPIREVREVMTPHPAVVRLDADDTLYGMCQAAARVLLRELGREFHEEGIRASEVTLPDPHRTEAGQCAEAVRGALTASDSEAAGFSIHKV